jgi:putative sigma-54 modulation protein
MRLTVTGRRVVVDAAARADITKKIGRLDRLLGDAALTGQCIVSRERGQYVCEVTVHARRDQRLVAVGRHARLGTAVAMAVTRVAQQAQKLIDRRKTRRKIGASVSPRLVAAREAGMADTGDAVGATEPPPLRIVRIAGYEPRPMTVEDAALALDDGADGILVFREAGSDRLTVLYRRADGRLGLVEPEV